MCYTAVMDFQIRQLSGESVVEVLDDLARLRIEVFREYPYLYDGSMEYEREYLKVYSECPRSIVAVVEKNGEIIGASTGMPLADEAPEFRRPFEEAAGDWDTGRIFYFGESVVDRRFRGNGFGTRFFEIREMHARAVIPDLQATAFCAVNRPDDHPQRPVDYRPPDAFWARLGYVTYPELVAHFKWKEAGEVSESEKALTFRGRRWDTAGQ